MKLVIGYIDDLNNTGNGYSCPSCCLIWTEDELFDYFDDNEDSVLLAMSFDYCPACTVDRHPDFSFQ